MCRGSDVLPQPCSLKNTDECKTPFNCPPIYETITIRTHNFVHKYMYLDNELCKMFNDRATAELRA